MVYCWLTGIAWTKSSEVPSQLVIWPPPTKLSPTSPLHAGIPLTVTAYPHPAPLTDVTLPPKPVAAKSLGTTPVTGWLKPIRKVTALASTSDVPAH